jgi:O-antigen/teichoic acid export membrane protein
MSTIRRQSILSSIVIYIGFAVGAFNTYLFTREGLFNDAQYGLTGIFIAIATLMMAFAQLAMSAYVYKFFPYYEDHLPRKKNEMLTLALLVTTIGFLLVVVAGIVFKDLVVRKFSERSEELVHYYNWIFPLGFGLTIYTILEAYAWVLHKSVLTNFLREVQWRLLTTVLIVLFLVKLIPSFDLFIKLYAFTYPALALILLVYLIAKKKIHFTLSISKVTKRFFKSILRLTTFVYGANLIFIVSQIFDSIVIGTLLGLTKVGIYTLPQYMASIVQAPQRGIISASIPHLSRAWKEKDRERIQNIYQRSSINQLIFACGLYILIVINFIDAVYTFQLRENFLDGFYVFVLLGAAKIVDMGTGVNAQIIGTSTFWRFELISGIILLSLIIPLNYFLTKQYDIIGPGIANLISMTVYNMIRLIFLWKKFGLFPFTKQTIYTLLLAAICFAICYFSFSNIHGLAGLFTRSMAFCLLYGAGVIYLKLTPDILPVWATIKKRFGVG